MGPDFLPMSACRWLLSARPKQEVISGRNRADMLPTLIDFNPHATALFVENWLICQRLAEGLIYED